MTWKKVMSCVFAISALSFCTEFCRPQSARVMTITEAKTSIARAPAITSALSSDGGLPEIPVSPLSTDEISTILSDLFKWEPARTRYSTYFLLLPRQQQIKQDQASKVWADPQKVGHYRPFVINGLPPDANPSIELAIHYVTGPLWSPGSTLVNTNAPFFRTPNPSDQPDQGDLVFVNLSGFSAAYVPIPVANVVESYFIDGLVARLIVGNYAKAADLKQSQLDFVKGNPPVFPNTATSYDDLRSYFVPLPVAPTYADAYSRAVSNLLSKVPVAPAAILLGWEAGEDLSHLNGDDKNLANITVRSRTRILTTKLHQII